MANITLSVPNWLYELMKKYGKVNWSEVARRAIIREALAIKGREEGLSKEELEILLKASGVEISPMTQMDEEMHKKVIERERRRNKMIHS